MLAAKLAHAGIVRHDMRMLAAPWRARIADADSMDDVRIQAAFAPGDAHDTLDLAVLYDVCECSAVPVGVEVKKYGIFFLTAIVRSITFLSGLPKAK